MAFSQHISKTFVFNCICWTKCEKEEAKTAVNVSTSVISESSIILELDTLRLLEFCARSKENIICVRVYDMQVTWITIDGCIWQRRVYGAFSRRQIGWIPIGLGDRFYYGCFSDAHIHILTQSSAIHCRLHDPSDYDFVETDTEFISIDRLIPLDESRYIIFRTKSLKAELWSYDEPRRNTHELQFSNTERVVDFHWHNSYLYSLTNNGEISKWRFLPKRRKQRVWIFTSHVNNCVRLISVAEHKFIIQAATRLVFDVVASSNSKT
ncbi:hypothetical protein Tcan_09821 [Toxocara canis]|uniref:Uncharacterized protein n=1 Tax=Toxocara canis TaxID=6265 RepID=A0A0B2VH83_TOXCA|nr:hypothetical protein Tcan_09821 [Toxocara canis]